MLGFLAEHGLLSFAADLARTTVWLFFVSLVFLPLEALFAIKPGRILSRTTLGDLGFYFVSGIVPSLLMSPILATVAVFAHQFVPWRVQAEIASWPLWLRAAAVFVVGEAGFYWGHRLTHQIPFLWQFHAVHHKPEHVYFLISARAHPLDSVFIRLCGFVPITALGLAMPLTAAGGIVSLVLVIVLTLWGFLIHANVRWRFGPLEWLVATPAFHHWHHNFDAPRDRNYASTLPLMDLVFGTFHLPRKLWPTRYGTETEMPASLVGQLIHPIIGTAGQPRSAESVAARPG